MLIPSKHEGYRAGRRVYPGKNDAPAPDPRIGESAGRQMALAEEQYKDFKSDYAPAIKVSMEQATRVANEQNQRQGQMQDYQLGRAKTYDARWDGTQVPLENELIATARRYSETDEQERMAGEAGADVNTAFARSGLMLQRDQSRRGINPSSGASMAMSNQNSIARAAAEASAMNKTRQAARDMGWTRMGEAAALGRGLPGFGATSANLSTNSGMNALSAGTAGVGLTAGASAGSSAGYTAGGGLYASAGGMLNNQYGAQSANVNAANNADASMWGAVTGAALTGGIKKWG